MGHSDGARAVTLAACRDWSIGATITFGVMEDENKVASFTGKLDGTKATGTYQSLTGGDEGTWSGTLSARPSSPQ